VGSEELELRSVPLFAALPEPRLRQIAECCPARRIRPGTVMARQGDRAESLIVVVRGRLSAEHHGSTGGRVQLAPAVAPCVLDKAVVLSGQRHQATWTARTPCVVRVMAGRFFRYLLAAEPGIREHALRYLSEQLTLARQERIDRDITDTPVRIARWLLEQRARHGSLVPLPAGQQGMAEELGLSRVTVNRALQSLVRSGVVRIHRGTVQVLDAHALFVAATRE
jgi:CRP/FNR family transcriptional regulator, cyclic AMP receptor protein